MGKYQKNRNLKSSAPFEQHPPVTRVKTDGRIGSVTPPSMLKGGFTVDNNQKAGPAGKLGSHAASHMSPSHEGGSQWSPRVKKARAMAAPGDRGRTHTNPVNHTVGGLKKVKPT